MNKKTNGKAQSFPEGFCFPDFSLAETGGSKSVLVGFSGGADSRVLLDLLCKFAEQNSWRVCAAHVNHGIRGAEADRDEAFCVNVAKKYGIDIFLHHVDIPSLAKESSKSVELCARDERYAFFARVMKENGIPLLATAHNANDNLETMLFNLARGTGLSGLSGIPALRKCEGGTLVRPILGMSREDVLHYCEENGLDFVTDSTNLDTDYTRNKIRAGIVPVLKEICPAAEKRALRTASLLKEDASLLSSLTDELLDRAYKGDGRYDSEIIASAHTSLSSRALIKLFDRISSISLEEVHVRAVLDFLLTGVDGKISLPNGFYATRTGKNFRFEKKNDIRDAKCEYYEVAAKEGENFISQTNAEIVIGKSHKEKNIYKKSIQLEINSATINGTLILRQRLAGDKIFMGGMHKSVKKLMCDKKIPPDERDRIPLLCDSDGVVAIPYVGVRDSANPKKCGSGENLEKKSIIFYLY
ncbi:MAG: tRNA lysidine(34) synthetase TilS [Clostridia bacterium]|nr:tRNA lysidine(34) synthetase TilS [Clostridia bacterium]